LVCLIVIFQGPMMNAQFVAHDDSLQTSANTDLPDLMNRLFGIAEGKLHHCFFSSGLSFYGISEIPVIQENLGPEEVMLEYSLTETHMTIFIISKAVFSIHQQALGPEFWKTIAAFRRKIRLADFQELVSLSHKLYLVLVAPAKQVLQGKKHLIVIPGKELLSVPFEALIVENCMLGKIPQFNQCHYLILDFEITYQFSAGQWIEARYRPPWSAGKENAFPEIDFAGFSPGSYQNPAINPLPFAQKELVSIAELFSQKGLTACLRLEACSSKDLFKEISERSRIIHFASHSHFNHDHPEFKGIVFWEYQPYSGILTPDNGILSAGEVESLAIKADLIVLNACASGSVSDMDNVRVISLPLGFVQAGAKNVLSTLWNVTDRLANEIMLGFYRKWLSGKTFSTALREVKLELIRCRETALPTIWASYMLIGQ